ncbi:MAG TPA: alpha/beta hydrolase [Ktedonobacterales bacterium]
MIYPFPSIQAHILEPTITGLQRWEIPLLLIQADTDPRVPPPLAAQLGQAFGLYAQVARVPGRGGWILPTSVAACAPLIAAFLTRAYPRTVPPARS